MRVLAAVLLFVLVAALLALAREAAGAPVFCAPYAVVKRQLENRFGERLQFQWLSPATGGLRQFWWSEAERTVSIVGVRPGSSYACLLANGENVERIPPAPPGDPA